MGVHLIDSCYENHFQIDLRRYHQSICKIKENEALLVEELNNNHRIIFSDGISSTFKLLLYNRLLYLVGDKTCYLCSDVVESAYGSELNWVKCLVMPGDLKVLGETDIKDSGVIVSLFSDLVPEIPNETLFFAFIDRLRNTFAECKWFKHIYSVALYIRLVKFWDYKEKISKLYELGLLYPLEFSIYTLYKKVDIKNERILKYFIASLAESTNKILSSEEIYKLFKSLTQNEIEDVLAFGKVVQNVQLEILNEEYFADVLEIDAEIRYSTFVNGTYYIDHMRNRAESIYKARFFKKEYFKTLKKNFRALENKIRKGKGFGSVGSYFMERLLFTKLKADFPNLTLYTQYSPVWLRPQRLDIYVQECNLAIEYHGAQHYLPIDFFGGIDGLESRKKLDRKKKDKCQLNSVVFFEISYEEDFDFAFENLKAYIKNCLAE